MVLVWFGCSHRKDLDRGIEQGDPHSQNTVVTVVILEKEDRGGKYIYCVVQYLPLNHRFPSVFGVEKVGDRSSLSCGRDHLHL